MLNLPMTSLLAARNAASVFSKHLPLRGFFVHSPARVRYSRVSVFSMRMFIDEHLDRFPRTTTTNLRIFFAPRLGAQRCREENEFRLVRDAIALRLPPIDLSYRAHTNKVLGSIQKRSHSAFGWKGKARTAR